MGGHGGLNILPQKSWNVYNRDNRQKVERDEAEARTAAAAQQRAAQSARLQEGIQRMRADARGEAADPISRHVNFFEAEERALGNMTYTADAKAADDRLVRRIMPDLQLDKSAHEPLPWYTQRTSAASSLQTQPHGLIPVDVSQHPPFAPHVLQLVSRDEASVAMTTMSECGREGDPRGTKKKKHKRQREEREHHHGHAAKRAQRKERLRTEEAAKIESLRELRLERMQREKRERTRAESIVSYHSSRSATNGHHVSASEGGGPSRRRESLAHKFLAMTTG
mmetsp:Transcript_65118/g.108182  ORF Transcript_65118/g.108182 Transcript_65118/m.108182 type:complete len:281 (+) Transcript_65118:212-1054(+)